MGKINCEGIIKVILSCSFAFWVCITGVYLIEPIFEGSGSHTILLYALSILGSTVFILSYGLGLFDKEEEKSKN